MRIPQTYRANRRNALKAAATKATPFKQAWRQFGLVRVHAAAPPVSIPQGLSRGSRMQARAEASAAARDVNETVALAINTRLHQSRQRKPHVASMELVPTENTEQTGEE